MTDLVELLNQDLSVGWFAVYLAFELIALMLVVDAVMKSRTSQGAVAWAVALITMPLITVPLYILVGQRRFYGYVAARRKGDLEMQKIARNMLVDLSQHFIAQCHEANCQALENLAGLRFTRSNSVDLLINGDRTFEALFAALDRAQDYVLVQFYIIRNDRIGQLFQKKLIERAKAGVRVYLMFDSIGSFALSRRYVRHLRKAGVEVIPFRTKPFNLRGRYQINFRNHRKIVVVDGREAFVGGLNVGDEYLGQHRHLSPWRDTHMALQGPAVLGVQLSFVEDWYWASGVTPNLNWQPQAGEGNSNVLVVPTGPADEVETCQLMFLQAINSAQQRLWIVSPYFVPDEPVIKAIKLAALRGVDVRIMVPGRSDNRLVQLSGFAHMLDTCIQGVRFYRYQRGFLHQKILLVDDNRSYIGTANLDNRSFRLNFELTVMVEDQGFAGEVEAMLKNDFDDSKLVTGEEILARGKLFVALSKMARLLSPLQ